MTETELERLIVRLVGDGTSYQKMLLEAERSTANATALISQQMAKIEGYAGALKSYASSAAFTLAGLVGLGGTVTTAFKGIQLSSDMEQLEVSFKVLTGSAATAEKTLSDLTRFAAETPFQMPEIVNAAKQMLGFGETAENIVPTMKKLGDVASGLNIPIGDLTYLFGTLKSQGRAFTVDINQFASRGIPIWDELGKMFGKTNTQVRAMVEAGKVGFKDVEKAFTNMTGQGGKFFNMMEEQSQTLSGLYSTLKDNVEGSLRRIGKTLIEKLNLKEGIKKAIEAAAAFEKWLTSSRVTRYLDSIAQLARDAGNTIASTFTFVKDKALEFVEANRKVLAGVAAGYVAYRLLRQAIWAAGVAITTVNAVLALLRVRQIATLIMWGVWTAAVVGAKATILLFSATMATLNALMFASQAIVAAAAFVYGIWTGATTAASVASGVLSGALTVLAGVISLVNFAAVASAVLVAAAAFVVISATAYALYEAVNSVSGIVAELWETFEGSDALAEPLEAITSVFGEWWDMLKQVAQVAQTDLPAAWKMLKAGLELAVSQAKDLFPPLWAFIREGFLVVFQRLGDVIENELNVVLAGFLGKIAVGLGQITQAELDKTMEDVRNKAKGYRQEQIGLIGKDLKDLGGKFKFTESDDTKKAREGWEKAAEEGRKAVEETEKAIGEDEAKERAKKAGEQIGKTLGDAYTGEMSKAVQNANGVLVGSAESMSRLAEYRDKILNYSKTPDNANPLQNGAGDRNAMKPVDASSTNSAQSAMKMEDYLKSIAKSTTETAAAMKNNNLAPAGF